MLQRGGRLILSPSGLNHNLAASTAPALDLARAREILPRRIPRPDAELVAERGREHERTVEQMRLVNASCTFADEAERQAGAVGRAAALERPAGAVGATVARGA
jgi:hypothetical protein